MTWRERWQELKRIYGGQKCEVRLTAVGWNPGGWTEVEGPTPSGNREYYIVVQPGGTPNAEQPVTTRLTAAERRQIELDLQREG